VRRLLHPALAVLTLFIGLSLACPPAAQAAPDEPVLAGKDKKDKKKKKKKGAFEVSAAAFEGSWQFAMSAEERVQMEANFRPSIDGTGLTEAEIDAKVRALVDDLLASTSITVTSDKLTFLENGKETDSATWTVLETLEDRLVIRTVDTEGGTDERAEIIFHGPDSVTVVFEGDKLSLKRR